MTIDEFRTEASDFLDAHALPRVQEDIVWGKGDDRVEVELLKDCDPAEHESSLQQGREWLRTRADAGFGWIDGPKRFGGRGLTPAHAQCYRDLEAGYDVPDTADFFIGQRIVAPAILAHAGDDIARRYLPGIHRGDIVGCQLFSEPSAGSDLASLATRAEPDGREWVVTGQKVWTSGAQIADIGEVLCRTDRQAPKHRGITAFLVDMHAPGVEVRPLRQMTGGAHFNEVFFDGVRVPDSHRLGEVNGGWTVALTTLMHERAALGSGHSLVPEAELVERLTLMLREFDLTGEPVLRRQLAGLFAAATVNRLTRQRISAGGNGAGPGPELSLTKLATTRFLGDLTALVTDALGPRLVADSGEWGTYAWSQLVCGIPGVRIAGGTDEILRNILAERVLGLPRE